MTMNTTHQNLTADQLDLLAVAIASPKVHTAATRLTEAARDELAMRDRRGREDGPLYRVVEAVLAGCDPAAVAEYLEREAAEVAARHAAARDNLAELRVQLHARRAHLRRHDAQVSAIARVLSGEIARLEMGSVDIQNRRTRELGTLVSGGFSMADAVAAVEHAEGREVARKLEALAAAGIDHKDAPPVLSDSQVSAQMRARAAPLRSDLERVHAFLREELRDVSHLPDWVCAAVEVGAITLHDSAGNRKLIPV